MMEEFKKEQLIREKSEFDKEIELKSLLKKEGITND